MLSLLPVLPAVAATAVALVQCGKDRVVQKKGGSHEKKGGASKRAAPSRSSRSVKTPSKKAAGGSQRSKKGTASGKSAKSAKDKSARSKSASKKGGSTKTAKGGASVGKLGAKGKKDEKKDKDKSARSKSTRSAKSKSSKSVKDSKKDKSSKSKKSSKSLKAAAKDKSSKENLSKKSTKIAKMPRAIIPKEVLELSAQELHWKPTGGLQKLVIHNKDKVPRAFKLKCSDNLLYRFSPVFGTIEPNKKVEVNILRNNGANKVDKLVILSLQAGEELKSEERFREVETRGEPRADLAVVPLIAL